jgi:hypothetical protein
MVSLIQAFLQHRDDAYDHSQPAFGDYALVFVLGLWIAPFQSSCGTNRQFQRLTTLLVTLGFLGGLFLYLLIRPQTHPWVQLPMMQYAASQEALIGRWLQKRSCEACSEQA